MSEIQTSISCTQKSIHSNQTAHVVGAAKTSNQILLNDADQVLQHLSSNSGYSIIPNLFLDKLRGVLGRNAYDVFMYIIRHTLGFHKLSDAISLSQFQHGIVTTSGHRLDYGCGIKGVETIYKALRELEGLGFITRTQVTHYNGGAGSNIYTICPQVILQVLETFSCETLTAGEETSLPDISTITSEKPTENRETELSQTSIPAQDNCRDCEPVISSPATNGKEGYSQPEGGIFSARKDKTQNSQNKQLTTKINTGGIAVDLLLETVTDERVQVDTILLVQLGLDKTTALRLALLAEKRKTRTDYVTSIVNYCRKNATTSPAGMAKRLIEQGEERTAYAKKLGKKTLLGKSAKLYTLNSSRISDVAELTTKSFCFEKVNRIVVWETVCSKLRYKMGKTEVAKLLEQMELASLEQYQDKLLCRVEARESWELRLLTSGAKALVELVLGQELEQPVVVQFFEKPGQAEGKLSA